MQFELTIRQNSIFNAENLILDLFYHTSQAKLKPWDLALMDGKIYFVQTQKKSAGLHRSH